MSITKVIKSSRQEYFIDSNGNLTGLYKEFRDNNLMYETHYNKGIFHGLFNSIRACRFSFYKKGSRFGQYNNNRHL